MLWFAQGSTSCRNHFPPPPAPLEISGHNSRVMALQKRWDRQRAGLGLIIDLWWADMADLPGGTSGLLCRDYKGNGADRLVTRIDAGVVSLVAELHAATGAISLERRSAPVSDNAVSQPRSCMHAPAPLRFSAARLVGSDLRSGGPTSGWTTTRPLLLQE